MTHQPCFIQASALGSLAPARLAMSTDPVKLSTMADLLSANRSASDLPCTLAAGGGDENDRTVELVRRQLLPLQSPCQPRSLKIPARIMHNIFWPTPESNDAHGLYVSHPRISQSPNTRIGSLEPRTSPAPANYTHKKLCFRARPSRKCRFCSKTDQIGENGLQMLHLTCGSFARTLVQLFRRKKGCKFCIAEIDQTGLLRTRQALLYTR